MNRRMSSSSSSSSSYEAARAAAIADNARALLEIGVTDASTAFITAAAQDTARAKRKRSAGPRERAVPPRPIVRRRSERIALAVSIAAAAASDSTAESASSSGEDGSGSESDAVSPERLTGIVKDRSDDRSELGHLPANSSKRLQCAVGRLLKERLGSQMPVLHGTLVKAGAMLECCSTRPRSGISFNKMSGIQEWDNAVVLFVNVGGTDYNNVFADGGRSMTWFAQPTQRIESPVVQRLVSGSCPVLLMCRLPGEPYVFCGRLRVVSVSPSAKPIKFLWALVDIDALQERNSGREWGRIVAGKA
jgi:hypothetical protein